MCTFFCTIFFFFILIIQTIEKKHIKEKIINFIVIESKSLFVVAIVKTKVVLDFTYDFVFIVCGMGTVGVVLLDKLR